MIGEREIERRVFGILDVVSWVRILKQCVMYLYIRNILQCLYQREREINWKTIMMRSIMDTAGLRVETRKECHNPVAFVDM